MTRTLFVSLCIVFFMLNMRGNSLPQSGRGRPAARFNGMQASSPTPGEMAAFNQQMQRMRDWNNQQQAQFQAQMPDFMRAQFQQSQDWSNQQQAQLQAQMPSQFLPGNAYRQTPFSAPSFHPESATPATDGPPVKMSLRNAASTQPVTGNNAMTIPRQPSVGATAFSPSSGGFHSSSSGASSINGKQQGFTQNCVGPNCNRQTFSS